MQPSLSAIDVKRWLDLTRGLFSRGCIVATGSSLLRKSIGGIDSQRDRIVAKLPKSVQPGNMDSVSSRQRLQCHDRDLRRERHVGASARLRGISKRGFTLKKGLQRIGMVEA